MAARRPWLRGSTLAVAWLVVLASASVGGANALMSSSAATGANTFTTATSFVTCPTTAPAGVEMIDGFEIGRVFGLTANSAFFTGANTAAVTADSTTPRNGTYSMRVAATGAATNAQRLMTTLTSVAVLRLAVRLQTLPVADVELLRVGPSSGTELQLLYHASTQKLALQFSGGTSVDAATTVTAGAWTVLDVKLDMTTASWAGSWRVNNTAQTARTAAGTAGTKVNSVWIGTTQANTYTANYDDIVVSAVASDYPLGDGKVLLLKPASMGTHNTATNFQNDDSTAINATTYQRIDDIPATASTDYIKQVTASATSYIELRFEATSQTCVRLVQGDLLQELQGTNQANNGKASIFDGSTERVVYSGAMTSTSTGQWLREAMIAPAASAWTPAALNAVVGRVGYSTDASPIPRWDALLLEYEVPL